MTEATEDEPTDTLPRTGTDARVRSVIAAAPLLVGGGLMCPRRRLQH
ncbi:hypothetical protein GCM10011331_23440 [Flavimobilis marinus]|uniref:Uncharacterized protein n=1 Tax=Flavimobilis marinus TaxID=285351 RepID=A0A1I2GJ17_9MICO|nr:hypothetical protein [Flavimobilis marinus]GHG56194.1 hypothetical protein GCM10011331_23440 [Flavimobilis marinus]SFF17894.1 hypothetical protein SAMN04488035_1826 [Flavimobilis marinus]